jgi:hypothetical protein
MLDTNQPVIGARKPTLVEAVEIVMQISSRSFRRQQLEHWRGLYGDSFADMVAAGVKARWKK